MKKFLPIAVIGIVILAGIVAFAVKGKVGSTNTEKDDSANVPVLPESQWPAVSLTPTDNPSVSGSLGHWLNFKIEKINVTNAVSVDYLMVYNTSDGGQQGVPGTVKLTGGDIERKLLLGSESSGKFRYDAGVETGTMTITFRDAKGKSLGKLTTDFHLQSNITDLTSTDGVFKYQLDKLAKNVYFVTMKTFLKPGTAPVIWQNGYGVFASDGKPHTGKLITQ